MITLAPIRDTLWFVRVIASTIIVTFGTLILSPTVMAAKADLKRQAAKEQVQQAQSTQNKSDQYQLSQLVVEAKELYLKLQAQIANQEDTTAHLQSLSELYALALDLDTGVTQEFETEKQWMLEKNLSPKLIKRLAKQEKHYRKEMDSFLKYLNQVIGASNPNQLEKKLKKALKHLDKKKLKKSQQPFDPNNLPHRNLQKKDKTPPKTSQQEYIDAGLYSTPLVQVAALGDFKYDQLAEADNPAYLAETDEVVLSDYIKAKAEELEYNPVKIYHFVLNEVEWQPTWGAIQDADLTLSAKRGNAMDIASLLIALLRASQIPARYVHGTIDVPKDRFNNWIGNFENINAAITYAANGGIPIAPVTVDGIFTKVRMEHIWVEAAIDFIPSRGAINRVADKWVEMDPSFKQYEYLEGLDIAQIAGVNPEQTAEDFINSGTVNETESYVQGLNSELITDLQEQVKTKLTDHINQMDNPTVGDVIGGRKTIIKNYPMLPSGLSNPIKIYGSRYDKLPSALQHKMTFAMSLIEMNAGGGLTFPFAKLNNQQVILSFAPATPEDEQALNSLIPEEEITDINQLPQRISSSIQVIPELKINGETVLTGTPLRLGEEVDIAFKMAMPSYGSWVKHSPVVAGSYLSIATVGGNVSPKKMELLHSKIMEIKSILETQEQAQLATITGDKVLSKLFYAGSLGYFSQFIAFSNITHQQNNSYSSLLPSFGTYGYEPEVSYFFNVPKSIGVGGIAMDLDSVTFTAAVGNGEPNRRLNLAFQLGILSSALEHAIPEQMFATPDNALEAASAVKLLQKASDAGQRIYHITPANKNSTLSSINHDSSTMTEISNALNSGKEVFTHTSQVNIAGWSGAGYILFDPETGSGAYKISGGKNGAFLTGTAIGVGLTMSLISTLSVLSNPAAAGMGSSMYLLLGAMLATTVVLYVLMGEVYGQEAQNCFLSGIVNGISATLLKYKIGGSPGEMINVALFIANFFGLTGASPISCLN